MDNFNKIFNEYNNSSKSLIKLIDSNKYKKVNVLSINALIEAARAGSNGNGFYVIAEEIRRLSKETDENLKEMKQTVFDVTNAFQEISCNSKERNTEIK